jgi:hypothetical protein
MAPEKGELSAGDGARLTSSVAKTALPAGSPKQILPSSLAKYTINLKQSMVSTHLERVKSVLFPLTHIWSLQAHNWELSSNPCSPTSRKQAGEH